MDHLLFATFKSVRHGERRVYKSLSATVRDELALEPWFIDTLTVKDAFQLFINAQREGSPVREQVQRQFHNARQFHRDTMAQRGVAIGVEVLFPANNTEQDFLSMCAGGKSIFEWQNSVFAALPPPYADAQDDAVVQLTTMHDQYKKYLASPLPDFPTPEPSMPPRAQILNVHSLLDTIPARVVVLEHANQLVYPGGDSLAQRNKDTEFQSWLELARVFVARQKLVAKCREALAFLDAVHAKYLEDLRVFTARQRERQRGDADAAVEPTPLFLITIADSNGDEELDPSAVSELLAAYKQKLAASDGFLSFGDMVAHVLTRGSIKTALGPRHVDANPPPYEAVHDLAGSTRIGLAPFALEQPGPPPDSEDAAVLAEYKQAVKDFAEAAARYGATEQQVKTLRETVRALTHEMIDAKPFQERVAKFIAWEEAHHAWMLARRTWDAEQRAKREAERATYQTALTLACIDQKPHRLGRPDPYVIGLDRECRLVRCETWQQVFDGDVMLVASFIERDEYNVLHGICETILGKFTMSRRIKRRHFLVQTLKDTLAGQLQLLMRESADLAANTMDRVRHPAFFPVLGADIIVVDDPDKRQGGDVAIDICTPGHPQFQAVVEEYVPVARLRQRVQYWRAQLLVRDHVGESPRQVAALLRTFQKLVTVADAGEGAPSSVTKRQRVVEEYEPPKDDVRPPPAPMPPYVPPVARPAPAARGFFGRAASSAAPPPAPPPGPPAASSVAAPVAAPKVATPAAARTPPVVPPAGTRASSRAVAAAYAAAPPGTAGSRAPGADASGTELGALPAAPAPAASNTPPTPSDYVVLAAPTAGPIFHLGFNGDGALVPHLAQHPLIATTHEGTRNMLRDAVASIIPRAEQASAVRRTDLGKGAQGNLHHMFHHIAAAIHTPGEHNPPGVTAFGDRTTQVQDFLASYKTKKRG